MIDTRPAARELVLRHGWNAVCYQVLNPGMQHWFAAEGDAVVGYATFGRTRVVVGAPVCASDRLEAVAAEFEAASAVAHRRVVFFAAGARLERLLGSTHSLVSLGAQPVWDPRHWPGIVRHKASLRAQLLRARNKGVFVTRWSPARARASVSLRNVLREWLTGRGLPPLHFMVEPELLDHVEDRRIFVAEREREVGDGTEVVGFLVAAPIPARDGWLVEQWPRARAAPNGTTHLLVDAAMRDLASMGAGYVSLGLAPLSVHGSATEHVPPPWMRGLLAWMRAHARRFYNFGGLEAFKAGLQPMAWEPAFAIAQGERFSLSSLRAIAGAFAGGSPELLVMRAVANAAVREARMFARR